MECRRYINDAVVLYAMLYGTVPFKANEMSELHELILQGNYTLPEGISTG
jgi:hypothetical protein